MHVHPNEQYVSRSHGGNCRGHAEISDDDLITAAQHGDQKAFVELCGRHYRYNQDEDIRHRSQS